MFTVPEDPAGEIGELMSLGRTASSRQEVRKAFVSVSDSAGEIGVLISDGRTTSLSSILGFSDSSCPSFSSSTARPTTVPLLVVTGVGSGIIRCSCCGVERVGDLEVGEDAGTVTVAELGVPGHAYTDGEGETIQSPKILLCMSKVKRVTKRWL